MPDGLKPATARLQGYNVEKNQNSISGLSSGAFMTVQLHLAHSGKFVGAGIIAGGPYRCVESFRDTALGAEDAYAVNALYICMTPLTPGTAPNAERLADLARRTAATGRIDPIANLTDDRLYIFTGSRDEVVSSVVVNSTRQFYENLGVRSDQIKYIDTVPAGHSIITDNVEDSPLGTNRPPYINYGGFMQSHDILRHIYGDLKNPSEHLSAELIRFDQSVFLGDDVAYASMGDFGYVYIPEAVQRGATARGVHIVLHGCKQGYSYINYASGLATVESQPPYGNRYMTTTGYNHLADANNIIVLYPQATGDDDNKAQNPDGCWDWWGYTSVNPDELPRRRPDPRHPSNAGAALQRSALNESIQAMTSTSLTVAAPREDVAHAAQRLMANAHPVLHHALRATALQTDWRARAMSSASATAQVFALGIDMESWEDLLQMQQAALQRLFTLQSRWMHVWKNWVLYSEQIRGANTMFKFTEREGNIAAQLNQILSDEAADMVGLLENLHVDYSYWINEKLREKRKSLSNVASEISALGASQVCHCGRICRTSTSSGVTAPSPERAGAAAS